MARSSLRHALCYPFRGRRVRYLPLALLVVVGCQDAPLDVIGGISTVETVPAMSISVPLPSPPALLIRDPGGPEVKAAVRSWEASWDLGPGGESVRGRARREVATHLVEVLTPEEIRSVLQPLSWAETEVGDVHALPLDLTVPLQEAAVLRAAADRAMEEGRLRDALALGMSAADRYRWVMPDAVARRTVARAARLLTDADTLPESVRTRGERLLIGARMALESQDYRTAIHRAFYACRVLEGAEVQEAKPGN